MGRRTSTITRLTAERRHYSKFYLGFNEKVRAIRHHGCRIVVVKDMKWSRYRILATTKRAEVYGCKKGLIIRSFVVDRPAHFNFHISCKVYSGDIDRVGPRQKLPKRRFEILDGPAHHLARIIRLSSEKRHYRFPGFRGKSIGLKYDRLLGRYFETKDYDAIKRPFKTTFIPVICP